MKWCIEYSEEQDQFHIETLEQRMGRPINGFNLIGYFDSEEDANKYLHYFVYAHDHYAEYKRGKIDKSRFESRMFATEELLRHEIGSENMSENSAYQYIHKIMMEFIKNEIPHKKQKQQKST
jgi:hypothetical protein